MSFIKRIFGFGGSSSSVNGDVEDVSAEHFNLLKKQVQDWQDMYNIPNSKVVFHRYYATNKSCPGGRIKSDFLVKVLDRTKPPVIIQDIPIQPSMCVAEKETIEKLKAQVSWYESLLKIFKK